MLPNRSSERKAPMKIFDYLKAWNWNTSRHHIDFNNSSVNLGQKINGKMKSNLLSSFYNNWIGVYGDIQVVEVSFGDIWITDLNVDGESHGKAAKGDKKGLHDAIIKYYLTTAKEECLNVKLLIVECR